MKKLMMIITALLLAVPHVYADGTRVKSKDSVKVKPRMSKSAEQRADKYTKWMEKEVQLTPDQRKAVYEVNLDIARKVDALKQNKTGDRRQMKEKREALETERDARLKPILTQVQWDKYVKAKAEKKEEMKDKKKDNKGKGKGRKKGHQKEDGE